MSHRDSRIQLDQIPEYVRHCLKDGIPREQIEVTLREYGLDTRSIERVFQNLRDPRAASTDRYSPTAPPEQITDVSMELETLENTKPLQKISRLFTRSGGTPREQRHPQIELDLAPLNRRSKSKSEVRRGYSDGIIGKTSATLSRSSRASKISVRRTSSQDSILTTTILAAMCLGGFIALIRIANFGPESRAIAASVSEQLQQQARQVVEPSRAPASVKRERTKSRSARTR